MEVMVSPARIRCRRNYLPPGICCLINPAAIKEINVIFAQIDTVMLWYIITRRSVSLYSPLSKQHQMHGGHKCIKIIAQCRCPLVAGAAHSMGYLDGIGSLTCPVKIPCQTTVCRVSWSKITDKETIIARQTIVKNNNAFSVKKHFIKNNRLNLDQTGRLTIHNLTRNDAGNYTCIRSNNDLLVVQLDVVGEYFVWIS